MAARSQNRITGSFRRRYGIISLVYKIVVYYSLLTYKKYEGLDVSIIPIMLKVPSNEVVANVAAPTTKSVNNRLKSTLPDRRPIKY